MTSGQGASSAGGQLLAVMTSAKGRAESMGSVCSYVASLSRLRPYPGEPLKDLSSDGRFKVHSCLLSNAAGLFMLVMKR